MGDHRVSKEALHEDEAMLETDSLVPSSDLAPALEATKPGSRITHLNWTKWSPFSPDNGDSLHNVDGNWTALLRVGMMGLTDEELLKTGASPDSVRLPLESGGGYLAYIADHHYLHCLYVLHQSLNQEYYSTRSVMWNMSAERRSSHWNHCIETLRQYVVCNADATVVTHYWSEHIDVPVPEQYNQRKCADWDAQFQWRLDRQVPMPHQPLLKPSDAVECPSGPKDPPPGYLSMYISSIVG
ncbi:hypothetical protein Hte_008261 [Hypoxylon texense]